MKEFDEIKSSLPYREDPAYVGSLIEKCREEARNTKRASSIRPWAYGVSIAAVAATALVLGISFSSKKSPMDSFLAGISDEEAEMIVELPLEDIPEYYYL